MLLTLMNRTHEICDVNFVPDTEMLRIKEVNNSKEFILNAFVQCKFDPSRSEKIACAVENRFKELEYFKTHRRFSKTIVNQERCL